MSNVSKGHNFEREVKKMFTDAGWFCTRAAASQSPMDLIAYIKTEKLDIFNPIWQGWQFDLNRSAKIPMQYVHTKMTNVNIQKVYFDVIITERWTVVLMQCKIKKRRRKKA